MSQVNAKRRTLRIGWTCCAGCKSYHRNRLTAWLHWVWLRIKEATR